MNKTFLQWLDNWQKTLPSLSLTEIKKNPSNIAFISVDMIIGFCTQRLLASPLIAAIVPEIVHLFTHAHTSGIRNFLLMQDAHDPHAEEFHAYPPHCIKGSEEAQTIPQLSSLSFAHLFAIIEKNSLNSYNTTFDEWMIKHPDIDTCIVVGSCTDLSVYSMAMHLRLAANSKNLKRRIIVPANCVVTYDLPIEKAQEINALPHDASLLHPLFLYHMALNGIEVVREIG